MRLSTRRIVAGCSAVLLMALGWPALPSGAASAAAADGPGALSHYDLARKDCVGTARNTTSKVWYTVAGGVLSDVYFPTIDNTNVESLQFIVSDGSTFTDLQTRDMTSTATALDAGGMVCRVTSTPKSGAYKLIIDYITDPDRNTVVMKVRLRPLTVGRLKVYARLDATINGNGGGGSGNGGADSATVDTSTGHPIAVSYDLETKTNAANRDYSQPIYAAMDGPFTRVASGFVGAASDGLVQLDTTRSLAPNTDAANGNVVQVAELRMGGGDDSGSEAGPTAVVALGFGASQAEAVAQASGSRGSRFAKLQRSYEAGWRTYDQSLKSPARRLPGLPQARTRELATEYYLNANVVKASEDKTFPGAIVAGLASPWGQAVSAGDPANTYFGSYREVFARDLYEAWSGLVAAGDLATAKDATLFLFNKQQQPDGSMPRNSLVNGKTAPDSFNTQLDEAAYPIVMANQLGLTDAALYNDHIKKAANFIISRGPASGPERWEEQSGYSPSTIAAEIAGLLAAADIAAVNGDATSANVWRGVADQYQRSIKGWTVTTTGSQAATPYFIRLSKTGDPNAAISYNVGNGGPTLDQRDVIDAGFLELSRLGELAAKDVDILASLTVVDAVIRRDTPSGFGWLRYNGDGYGDDARSTPPTGSPWAPSGKGSGHLWPALSAERAEHALQIGDASTAAALLSSMASFAGGVGIIPEQDWELPAVPASPYGTDPTTASIGFTPGQPAGSAAPLTWSAGAYVRLAADLAAGSLGDTPTNTVARYVTKTQGQTPIAITSPANNSLVTGSPVTVTGTSAPGNRIDVLATNVEANSATSAASTTAAADGTWTVSLDITGGTLVINAVATSPAGATGQAVTSVVFDFVPGTVLLDVTDPSNDDNGPGNYAYPTAGDFKAGAFDLEQFQVLDDGTNVIFRVRTRDLTPTFGSPLGAQLVDIYVHDPAATTTSTQSSFGSRNYVVSPGSAWSTLIEAQGFGQRYVDASGATKGTVAIRGNQLSRYITITVPKATLGQPTSGWGFTVVLTGQDGFSSDQSRSFAATPQGYNFGVCAATTADPHCTADPGTVPKAMDVLTPTGVNQATELDYTLATPVTIAGVSIP